MTDQEKARKQSEFLIDIVSVMEKHKVKDVLLVYGINGEIRNSYLFTDGENEIYSFLSDGIDAWMKQEVKN